jgi:hypothetical protein
MISRFATWTTAAAMALAPIAASAHSIRDDQEFDRSLAVRACLDFAAQGAAKLVDVVADGLGDYLVWIEDASGVRWACNATGYGEVLASARIGEDLLGGKGANLIHLVSDNGFDSPSTAAERACGAMGGKLIVITTAADGAGGYLVWLATSDGDYVMCDGTSDGKVLVFEVIDAPLNGGSEAS